MAPCANCTLQMMLQQKEKEYLELKEVLARQPGPEVAEQLQVYQQAVKDKTRQLQVGLLRLCAFVLYAVVLTRR